MTRLVTIFVILGLVTWVLHPIGPYMEYALNRDFIANNYCVNQDKPELKCKGSCYLMQRIKAQAENAGHQGKVVIQEISAELCMVIPSAFTWSGRLAGSTYFQPWQVDPHSIWKASTIDPPPQYL